MQSSNNQRKEEELAIEKLQAEIADKKKALATLRANITPLEVKDYTFEDHSGNAVKLSELYGDKQELILVSNMGKGCKYCTLWADNFNGIEKPLSDRAAFVVVSPDAPDIQKAFAASRGWKFRMLSHQKSNWANDFGFKAETHFQPGVLAYTKDDNGRIFFHSKAYFGPGDNYCNMWDFIDLLPKGVDGWIPKYEYS